MCIAWGWVARIPKCNALIQKNMVPASDLHYSLPIKIQSFVLIMMTGHAFARAVGREKPSKFGSRAHLISPA